MKYQILRIHLNKGPPTFTLRKGINPSYRRESFPYFLRASHKIERMKTEVYVENHTSALLSAKLIDQSEKTLGCAPPRSPLSRRFQPMPMSREGIRARSNKQNIPPSQRSMWQIFRLRQHKLWEDSRPFHRKTNMRETIL